jgi:hypothetical protein
MPKVFVCFYVSTGWTWWVGALIRLGTRRRGQPWKATPSHVGIEFQEHLGSTGTRVLGYFEAITQGVCRQDACSRAGLIWRVPVLPLNPQASLDFCTDALVRRAKYDYRAVLLDTLGLCLPARVDLSDIDNRAYDCSRLVACALQAGGYPVKETHDPISPNDLLQQLTGDH